MNNWIKLLIYLAIGFAQMGLAWWIGVHRDLPHMQYEHWYGYVFEAIFYAGCWAAVISYLNNQCYDPGYEEWLKTHNIEFEKWRKTNNIEDGRSKEST